MSLTFLSSIWESLWTKEVAFCGLAAIGGLVVLCGLWLEYISTDEDRYEKATIEDFRSLKSKEKLGEKLVMVGIWIEIGIAVLFAGLDVWDKHEINIATAKNNPLLQPATQISATLLLTIATPNFTQQSEQNVRYSFLNFNTKSITNFSNQQIFSVAASSGRYFLHQNVPTNGIIVIGGPTPKVTGYTVGLRFEQEGLLLPSGQPLSIENTNSWDDFPEISITNALSEIRFAEAYINFLPTNTVIIRGRAVLSINGYRMDFSFNSNSISREMSEYNPDKKGIFIESKMVP